MKNQYAEFVKYQLPTYVKDNHHKFHNLIKLYYKWYYRHDGMSINEITTFRNNIDKWTSIDIDKFIKFGSQRYINNQDGKLQIENDVTRFRNAGALSDSFHGQFMLEREFDAFVTADGEFLEDENETKYQAQYIIPDAIVSWGSKFRYKPSFNVDELETFDQITLVKNLKMLYAAKGTIECLKLFFNIFFNETVTVYVPKFDLASVDAGFVLDGTSILRDDAVYNEFSFVVYVKNDPSYYKSLYESIYLANFHPSGFLCKLIKKS